MRDVLCHAREEEEGKLEKKLSFFPPLIMSLLHVPLCAVSGLALLNTIACASTPYYRWMWPPVIICIVSHLMAARLLHSDRVLFGFVNFLNFSSAIYYRRLVVKHPVQEQLNVALQGVLLMAHILLSLALYIKSASKPRSAAA